MQKKITLYYVTDADVEKPDPDSLNKWVESFQSSMDEMQEPYMTHGYRTQIIYR